MPEWTDIRGLAALLDQRGKEIAALQQSVTALTATCTALTARVAALETPGKPPTVPPK